MNIIAWGPQVIKCIALQLVIRCRPAVRLRLVLLRLRLRESNETSVGIATSYKLQRVVAYIFPFRKSTYDPLEVWIWLLRKRFCQIFDTRKSIYVLVVINGQLRVHQKFQTAITHNLTQRDYAFLAQIFTPNSRRCTIKIKLLGFLNFLHHCFLESVSFFTVSNLLYLFEIISEFRLGAKIGDARLWE